MSEKLTHEQLLDAFAGMTLIELSEFQKAFEERFGVTAAVAAVAAPAGGAGPAAAEEQTEFTAILSNIGEQRINVIKEIRAITGLGLKEAKALVEGAPQPIKENVSKAEAEDIKKKLQAVGAAVEIK
ncbi:MAG: 50S ribosomal protein L7/L12 [Deltaproteobacteria bacterium RBG_13_61_14]|nr:MAG: 50S ribosomal protein L7/L12 [Deltaproteobacteria bacterium RBG_13_61_14]